MPNDSNRLQDQQQIAEHELLSHLRTGPLAPHVRQMHHAKAVSIGASGRSSSSNPGSCELPGRCAERLVRPYGDLPKI